MAGTVAHRELKPAKGVRFAVAEPANDAAIRRLLRSNPMEGSISVTFEREPAYARGTNIAGGRDRTIVAYAGDQLVCMGRCTRRTSWVAGQEATVGYLAELRLDARARSRFDILLKGYRYFHRIESDEPAEAYFTSIGADNERALRLLERGGLGLPTYQFLADFETLLIAVPMGRPRVHCELTSPSAEHVPAMLDLLNTHGRRYQLSPVWSAETLQSLGKHGLPLDRFRLLIIDGEVVASGALWDQRAFRQTVVQGYAGPLSFFRPMINLTARPLGMPCLPKPGTVLSAAFLSPLVFAEGATSLLSDFVEGFFPLAASAGLDFLTVGLPGGLTAARELRRRFHTRTWGSRLYQVEWPDNPMRDLRENAAAFFPDVALL